MKLHYRTYALAVIFYLCFFPINAAEPPAYLQANEAAQQHAQHPTGWVVNNLKTVTGPSDGNYWRGGGSEVLVRAFTSPQYYNLTNQKFQNLYPSALWVTTGNQLPDWYKNAANGVNANNVSLKTAQLHGLPVSSTAQYNAIVEIWVDPAKLVRPTRDPNIQQQPTKLSDQPDFAPQPAYMSNTDYNAYKTWYTNNITASYGNPNPDKRYPWTQLGYTYNWGGGADLASINGLSEFVVMGTRAGVTSPLETFSVYSIQSYLYQYGDMSVGNFNITGDCDTVWAGTNFQQTGNQITVAQSGSVHNGEGIFIYSNGYTVTNNGLIYGPTSQKYYNAGPAGTSVYFRDGGTFVNNAGAAMYGDNIAIGGGDATVNPINISNAGYISGTQFAVSTGSGDDTLTIENGGVVDGSVAMGAGNDSIHIKNGGQFTTLLNRSNKTAFTLSAENISLDNGAILAPQLTGVGVLQNGDQIQLAAATAINGNFTSISNPYPVFNFSSQVTGGNSMALQVSRNSYKSVAGSVDSKLRGVGSALDSFVAGANGDTAVLLSDIDSMPSAGLVAQSVRQLSPMVYTYIPQVTFENSRMLFQNIFDRPLSLSNVDSLPLKNSDKDWRAYGASYGFWGRQNNVDQVAGYSYNSWNGVGGLERSFAKELLMGLAVGAGSSNINVNDEGGSHIKIDSVRPVVYSGLSLSRFHIELGAGYGYNQYNTNRKIEFGSIDRSAKSDHDGHEFFGMLSSGYKIFLTDNTVLEPEGNVYSSMLHETSFGENNADAANLNVASRNSYSLKSGLGLRLAHNFVLSENWAIKPEVSAKWWHEFFEQNYDSNASFSSGGPSFSYSGMDYDRNSVEIRPKFSVLIYKQVCAFMEYDLSVSKNNISNGINMGLEASFNPADLFTLFY